MNVKANCVFTLQNLMSDRSTRRYAVYNLSHTCTDPWLVETEIICQCMKLMNGISRVSTWTTTHVSNYNVKRLGFSLCMVELMSSEPKLNCVIGLMTSAITPMSDVSQVSVQVVLHEGALTRVDSTEMTGMDVRHSTRFKMQGFTRPEDKKESAYQKTEAAQIKTVLTMSFLACRSVAPGLSRLCGRDVASGFAPAAGDLAAAYLDCLVEMLACECGLADF